MNICYKEISCHIFWPFHFWEGGQVGASYHQIVSKRLPRLLFQDHISRFTSYYLWECQKLGTCETFNVAEIGKNEL